ncbi:MAG TPA: hypothetical protein VF498_17110 [Anaerolineales bacterium]
MSSILAIQHQPYLPGVRIPHDFYQVLQEPAPRAGMAHPRQVRPPWQDLHRLGLRHIICLAESAPGYTPAPLKTLYAASLEDLFHGGPPQKPRMEARLLREAVEVAASKLQAGEGVVVHCQGGTGRTGTVIGCLLRRLGFESGEVLAYLNDLNLARGKPGWPESEWQAQMVHSFLSEL